MLSGIVTVGLLLLFVAVWIWAWQPHHKAAFEATARLAVEDDDVPAAVRRERGQ